MIATENSAPRFAVLQPLSVAPPTGAQAALSASPGERAIGEKEQGPFGNDGLTFADVLDVINPLQHLPIISTIYRNLTGDTIDPAPRIAGSALFGGPIGAFFGIVNVISESETGRDVGEHVLAWIEDGIGTPENPALADSRAQAISAPNSAAYAAYGAATPDTRFFSNMASTPTARAPGNLYAGFAGDNDEAALVLEESSPNITDPTAGIVSDSSKPLLMSNRYVATKPPVPGPLFGHGDSAATGSVATATPVDAAKSSAQAHLSGHIPFAPIDAPSSAFDKVEENANRSATSPGALAADGGWFTEAMLSALEKYQKAGALSGASVQSINGEASTAPTSLGAAPNVASPAERNDVGFISG